MSASSVLLLLKMATIPHGMVFRERRPGLVILGYHRVGAGTDSDIDLPAAEFDRQMAYLRAQYRVVSMDAIADGSVSPEAPGQADVVAVTFDDGAREIYEHAFPVLRRYGIPATIYLSTRYIEEQQTFDFGGYAHAASRPRPLSWAQVREMADSGLVSVGAHAHTHADLTRLSVGEVRDEVEHSHRLIVDRIGRPPRHFAYPWGAYSPAVRQIVGEYFVTAVRGGCGKNPFGAIDPLALWRRPIQQVDRAWLFRLKLHSYLDGEELARTLAARVRTLGHG